MEISAKMVKELRDKTNAGMMDCKKALAECDCQMEKAVDWLRQKGLMTARKREGRATKEGLVMVGVAPDCKKAVIVELNCETDFVAKNDGFQKLSEGIVKYLLENKAPATVAELLDAPHPDGGTVKDAIANLVGTIGENMNLRRFMVLEASSGAFLHSYIHGAYIPGAGRMGVIVEVAAEKHGEAADALAHDIAMHIAAANPAALKADQIPQEMVEREKGVFRAKLAESGKPEAMWDKIVEGQVKKFYTEVALLEQAFVKEPSKSVSAIMKEAGPEIGKADINGYVRFQLGEEIEGEEAAE